MRAKITGLILAVAFSVTARPSSAVDKEAGTASANIVSLQSGARAAGMGGAFSAVADDLNAIYHNVAGAGFFTKSEFAADQASGFADMELSDISIALPLGDVTASNVRQLGTIVFNIGSLDYGNQQALSTTGSPIGRLEAKDETLAVGWAKAFNERLAIGGLARGYRSRIFAHEESGTVIDGGLLIRAIPDYLNLAFTANDVGNDTPTEYRAGIAIMPAADRLILSAEGGTAEDRSSVMRAGLEFRPVSVVALRVGYDSAFDAGSGISFGAGLRLLDLEVGFFPIDRVTLDYAFQPTDDLEEFHRVSIGARIGTQ